MPVSTRSQFINEVAYDSKEAHRTRNQPRSDEQVITHTNLHTRNPQQGLIEKMRALSLLYEKQKITSAALRNQSPKPEEKRIATTRPSFERLNLRKKEEKESKDTSFLHNVMKENTTKPPSSTITRTFVLPQPPSGDDKDNLVMGPDCIRGLPRKASVTTTVARKLSTWSSLPQRETREVNGAKMESPAEKVVDCGSRILVFVRLRPMSKKEKEARSRCCVRIVNKQEVYLTEFANENDYLRLKRLRGRHFTFDASFSDSTTQQEVYSTTTAEVVEAVLHGRNGSVFCYGATGAGKTYTMLGTVENPGVTVLAIKDLFAKVRQRSCDGNHEVRLSYLEVYNETVRDLLSPGRPLVLREDKEGIVAAGLTQYRAYSADEVMALLQRGNQNRTTEPTRANETSSRSHGILQVVVEYRVKDASMNIVRRAGKLSLIDLAGSERALATDPRTVRSIEGANINRSLLALSGCINALVEGKKHIPYRNSKLTQLLKDSLGGACNTVMIANISPCDLAFCETQNTLHWADQAKEIRTKAAWANEELLQVPESKIDQAKLLLELQKENRELRVQIARQQQKLLALQAQSLAANTSPTPSSVSSLLTPPSTAPQNEKRKPRSSFFMGNCFSAEFRRIGAQETVRELQLNVKSLKAEVEGMKKDHALQIKHKDELLRKSEKSSEQRRTEGANRTVTRAQRKKTRTGDLKSPSHRFCSPVPTAKKRSFWDITTADNPSVATSNGRKTRSHVTSKPAPAPSLLLQPGFARQKPYPSK